MKTLISKFTSGFTKRERVLFISTISVVMILGVYIFVLEPVYKKGVQLKLDLESKNAQMYKSLKLLANKEGIEKEYAKYKDYIEKTADGDQEASILKEIESTALNCGVKITSIKPKGTKQLKNYIKFSAEVVSEGTISQFLKFIYDLEGSKKLLKVERVILSLKSSQSDLLKATLIIRKISF